MAEQVVIDIELKGFGTAKKSLDDLTKKQVEMQLAISVSKQEVSKYEQELKKLNKVLLEGGELTAKDVARSQELATTIERLNIGISKEKDELSKVNTERRNAMSNVDAYNKVLSSQIGSNDQLKAQLKILTSNYNALSKEQRENTTEGKDLQIEIEGITDALKANEKAIGDNRRNVGNYSGALTEAFGDTEVFGTSLNGLKKSFDDTSKTIKSLVSNLIMTSAVTSAQAVSTESMTVAQKALNAATIAGKVAMNIFKLALIATGIGAFVVVLGSLAAYFLSTEKGASMLNKVMVGVGVTMTVLKDRVIAFGGALTKIFSGDFSGGFADMKASFKGIGDEILNGVNNAILLENQLKKLENRETAVSVARSTLNKQIKEQTKLVDDNTKSSSQRLAAINKIIELEKEQSKLEQKLANDQLLQSLKLNGSYEDNIETIESVKKAFAGAQGGDAMKFFITDPDQVKNFQFIMDNTELVAEAIIKNNDAISASGDALSSAESKKIALLQEASKNSQQVAKDNKKISDEETEKNNQRIASIEELLRSEKQELDFQKEKLLQDLELNKADTELTATEASAKKLIIDQYNKDVIELEMEALATRQQLALDAINKRIDVEKDAGTLVALENEKNYLKQFNALNGNLDAQQKLTNEYNKQKLQDAKTLAEQEFQVLQQQLVNATASIDGGIPDVILSEEMLADLKKRLAEAGVYLATLDGQIAAVGSTDENNSLAGKLGLDAEQTEQIQASYSAAVSGISTILDVASQNLKTQTDERIAAIDSQIESGVISEEDAEKKKVKIRKDAFEKQKKLDRARATLSYFTGLIQAIAGAMSLPPPANFIVGAISTAALTATYAANVKQIDAQKFADGGLIQGASHSKGGVPFSVAGRGGFEAEGGEFIHKTKAVEHYGLPFMNALNNMQLPKVFAEGGYVAPMTSSSISQQVSEGVSELVSESQNRSIQVLNVESDFSNLQNKVNNVESARTY
jgi:hypothetical protein